MDLHNSTVYSGKTTETELDRDTFGTVNSWSSENGNEEYFIGVEKGESSFASGASVCFGQPIVGLKFGMPKDTENWSSTTNSTAPVSLNSMSSNTAKRSRVSYQSMQTSRCQVEGCNLDLKSAKDYHRRHRICESHSKSPMVIIAGVERRFCQQCSRFHNLSEFDDKKRSCRRRLSDHNARRRRPHLETMHSSSVAPSSSLYGRRPPSFLLNRTPSLSSNTCESSGSLKLTQAGNPLIRSSDASAAHSQSPLNEAQNLPRALSLLSTTTWALNEPESTSLEQLMQGSVSTAQPSMPLELQNRPLISAAQVSAEQAHPLSSHLHLQGTDNYHFRDLQSFEPPYEHGFYFSNRIN